MAAPDILAWRKNRSHSRSKRSVKGTPAIHSRAGTSTRPLCLFAFSIAWFMRAPPLSTTHRKVWASALSAEFRLWIATRRGANAQRKALG